MAEHVLVVEGDALELVSETATTTSPQQQQQQQQQQDNKEDTGPPGIAQVSTFDSASYDDIHHHRHEGSGKVRVRRQHGHHHDFDDQSVDSGVQEGSDNTHGGGGTGARRQATADELPHLDKSHDNDMDCTLFASWKEIASQAIYVSIFAVFGTVLRIYLGRLFGLDCELHEHDDDEEEHDFFTPFFSQVCVTSSGRYERGGALFVDLPSNILGCFIMGILSPARNGQPLPWFRADHPLQRHTAFQIGLKVGFCGCMTSFASWNTQMVVMLDGTETEFGPQVAAALCGYLIGIASTVSSFLFGQHIYEWLRRRHDAPTSDCIDGTLTAAESMDPTNQDAYSTDGNESHCHRAATIRLLDVRWTPVILLVALFAAFAIGDAVQNNLYYRKMWLVALLTPFGAVLRWRLSEWNLRRKRWTRCDWFPWGTFASNFIAVLFSLLAESLWSSRVPDDDESYTLWVSPVFYAVKIGFAGSLSTVSTLVREMFFFPHPSQAHKYWSATVLFSMMVGLAVYSPIVRS